MRVVIVPGTLALLPTYRSVVDPIPDLRAACLDAVSWLLQDAPEQVAVWGDARVARALVDAAGFTGDVADGEKDALLVVANGSARRGEKAPGHLDERSFGYDEDIGRALADGDGEALTRLDVALGVELLAAGIEELCTLGRYGAADASVLYDDDPYGVQYWVVTWLCRS